MTGRLAHLAARGAGAAWLAAALAAPPPAAVAEAPSAVPADTTRVSLTGPSAGPVPVALRVVPGSVEIGGAAWVVLEFPPGRGPARPQDIKASGDAVLLGAPGDGDNPATARPASGGAPSTVLVARLHSLGPVVLAWGEGAAGPAATVVVTPRLSADASPAPYRDLVGLGWRWERILAVALLAAAVAVAVRRLRRRGRVRAPDAALPPPPYLATAIALEELRAEEWPRQGEGRRFLDRLSGIARAYLHDRFGLRAAELTPGEIAQQLAARGHGRDAAGRWRDLLAGCDARRYAPDGVKAGECDQLLADAVRLLALSRVPARFTPVPADLAARGDLAWDRLRTVVGRGGEGALV